MKRIAARFRTMMEGRNENDKKTSAELLYLFIKELSLYFDNDVKEVIKKVNRGSRLNLENLKMKLCHEYIGKRIIS